MVIPDRSCTSITLPVAENSSMKVEPDFKTGLFRKDRYDKVDFETIKHLDCPFKKSYK